MIKTLLIVAYNIIRVLVMRVRYGGRYNVNWIQRISGRSNVSLFEKGKVCIGRNIEAAPGCDFQVHGNGSLEIGDGTYFNRYCMISAHGNIHIGKHCLFGPGVKIFDNNHKFDVDGVSTDLNIGEIFIGDRCWIASDAIILKGAHLGDGCVIGAGCIIDRDIPAGSLVKVSQSQTVIKIK